MKKSFISVLLVVSVSLIFGIVTSDAQNGNLEERVQRLEEQGAQQQQQLNQQQQQLNQQQQRIEQNERDIEEIGMRLESGEDPSGGNPLVEVASPLLGQAGKRGSQAGAALSVGSTVHKIIFGGPKCNECDEYVDNEWDHRYTCAEGHWYWRCRADERAFHRYCTPADAPDTDCSLCQGEGCRYCNSY